jgi:hypothetical protein
MAAFESGERGVDLPGDVLLCPLVLVYYARKVKVSQG